MKINMADNEYFPVGTVLSCTMCNGRKIQGEVMGFDHASKVLAISILSKSRLPLLYEKSKSLHPGPKLG